MADGPRPLSRTEREARRLLLHDALRALPDAPDTERAADDIMRALDSYIEAAESAAVASREPPVTDYRKQSARDIRWATVLIIMGAILSTIAVAVVLAGGWVAAAVIVGIWAVALVALVSS